MKLQLFIKNNHLLLQGTSADPLILENVADRFKQAQDNCATISEQEYPIFIGCEHLKYLEHFKKPFLLIEKSPDYYNLLIQQGLIKQNIKANLIFGNIGFASPLINPKMSYAFVEQEMLLIAEPFLQQLLNLNQQSKLYWIFSSQKNNVLESYLYRTLLLTIAVATIHNDNQKVYKNIKGKNKNDSILILHRNIQDEQSIKDIVEFNKLKNTQYLNLDYPDTTAKNLLIYDGIQKNICDISDKFIQESLQAPLKRYYQILNTLKNNSFTQAAQRNRSIYGSLEDYLFIKPLFDLCEIPLYSFWIDYQQHQFSGFEGGFLHSSIDKQPQATFFTLDSGRTRSSLFYYPVSFQPKQIQSNNDFSLDIAIMHYSRPGAFEWPQFNLVYELLKNLSSYPLQVSYFVFFDALYNFYNALSGPFKPNALWTHMINMMHFAFYHMVRRDFICQAINILSPQFSIKVFGPHWPQWLPQEFCEPATNNPESIYSSSLVTLDITPLDTAEAPAFSAIRALSFGGLPLVLKPAYKSQSGFSTFSEENFYYFSKPESLIPFIEDLKNNPHKRNHLRSDYLNKLNSALKSEPLKLNELKPLKSLKQPHLSFTGDKNKDDFVLFATLGCLLELSGYPAYALEIWKECVKQKMITTQSLIKYAWNLSNKFNLKPDIDFWNQLNSKPLA